MFSESICTLHTDGACICMPSCFSCVQLFVTLWTIAHQALCTWESTGKNTRVARHFLLQGIFSTQGSIPGLMCLLCWQMGSLPPETPGKHTKGSGLPIVPPPPNAKLWVPRGVFILSSLYCFPPWFLYSSAHRPATENSQIFYKYFIFK